MNATERLDKIIDEASEPLLVTAKVFAMCDDHNEEQDVLLLDDEDVNDDFELPVATSGTKIGLLLYFCALVLATYQLQRISLITDLL